MTFKGKLVYNILKSHNICLLLPYIVNKNRPYIVTLCPQCRLHDDKDTWMVPLSTLAGPYFVVYLKGCNNTNDDNMYIDDRADYIMETMTKWGDSFLPIYDV